MTEKRPRCGNPRAPVVKQSRQRDTPRASAVAVGCDANLGETVAGSRRAQLTLTIQFELDQVAVSDVQVLARLGAVHLGEVVGAVSARLNKTLAPALVRDARARWTMRSAD